MSTPFVEEFLYRGRDPEGDQDPAWHLVLGVVNTDPLGNKSVAVTAPMTMEQAKAAGWDLPDILKAMESDVLAHADALAAKLTDVEGRLAETTNQRDEAIQSALVIEEALDAVAQDRDALLDEYARSTVAKNAREAVLNKTVKGLPKDARETFVRAMEAAGNLADSDLEQAVPIQRVRIRKHHKKPSVRLPEHLRKFSSSPLPSAETVAQPEQG